MEQKLNNGKSYIEHGHLEHGHDRNNNSGGSRRSGATIWLVIGVVVLIILLILWLTIADLWGDTDVAAQLVTSAAHTGAIPLSSLL